jgi:hypothetical protein
MMRANTCPQMPAASRIHLISLLRESFVHLPALLNHLTRLPMTDTKSP